MPVPLELRELAWEESPLCKAARGPKTQNADRCSINFGGWSDFSGDKDILDMETSRLTQNGSGETSKGTCKKVERWFEAAQFA